MKAEGVDSDSVISVLSESMMEPAITQWFGECDSCSRTETSEAEVKAATKVVTCQGHLQIARNSVASRTTNDNSVLNRSMLFSRNTIMWIALFIIYKGGWLNPEANAYLEPHHFFPLFIEDSWHWKFKDFSNTGSFLCSIFENGAKFPFTKALWNVYHHDTYIKEKQKNIFLALRREKRKCVFMIMHVQKGYPCKNNHWSYQLDFSPINSLWPFS